MICSVLRPVGTALLSVGQTITISGIGEMLYSRKVRCKMPPRRFPLPWKVEQTAAALAVKDAGEQPLAYCYFEEDSGTKIAQ